MKAERAAVTEASSLPERMPILQLTRLTEFFMNDAKSTRNAEGR